MKSNVVSLTLALLATCTEQIVGATLPLNARNAAISGSSAPAADLEARGFKDIFNKIKEGGLLTGKPKTHPRTDEDSVDLEARGIFDKIKTGGLATGPFGKKKKPSARDEASAVGLEARDQDHGQSDQKGNDGNQGGGGGSNEEAVTGAPKHRAHRPKHGKVHGKPSVTRRDPSGAQFYEVGDGQGDAKVWSSVDPDSLRVRDAATAELTSEKMQRRDPEGVTWHEVGEGQGDAKVWSSVEPSELEARDNTNDFKPQTEADVLEWMVANNIKPEGDHSAIEKRVGASWKNCGICMAICGANAAGIHSLSTTQKVQFCLGNCVAQGACTVYFRAEYQDEFPNSFAPAGTFPVHY